MSDEPVPGRLRHALKRTALFERVGGTRHDGEFALVCRLAERAPVERQDFRVRAADDSITSVTRRPSNSMSKTLARSRASSGRSRSNSSVPSRCSFKACAT